MLDLALEQVVSEKRPALDLIETVLGQFMHYAQLWRPAMSVPHALYTFVQKARWGTELWPLARQEVQWMRSLLPLLRLDVGRRVAPIVLAQDAAGPSIAVHECATGAYCWGVGRPPVGDIRAVADRVEVRGRLWISDSSLPAGLLDTV